MAHSKRGTRLPPPIQVFRPYDNNPPEAKPPRRMATGAELKQFVAAGKK